MVWENFPMPLNENLLLSIPETSTALRIPAQTLRDWIKAGHLATHSDPQPSRKRAGRPSRAGTRTMIRLGEALDLKTNPPRKNRRQLVLS